MPSRLPRVLMRCGAAVASAGVLALALSGCVAGPASTPTPSPSASAEPIFASDEEALAAATDAYESFESLSQLIAAESGERPERIADVVTPAFLPQLLDEFAQYQELGIRIEGVAKLDSFSLAEHVSDHKETQVTIYVCRDVTGVRVLDGTGADVTPVDRDDRTPLIATLVSRPGNTALLVSMVELWPGEDFC